MKDLDTTPQVGQAVKILRGRDAGEVSIIIKIIDERFVFIADGDNRKYDRAKRKNINHLKLLDFISPEVKNSFEETGRVTNGKLRFAISKFLNEYSDLLKEGE